MMSAESGDVQAVANQLDIAMVAEKVVGMHLSNGEILT
jgi:hypothetical protein